MTAQLLQIQTVLKQIVLYFIEGQGMNMENVYTTKVNAAETHLRIIANKRAPYLVYQLLQELRLTEVIELDQPKAEAQYVVQIIGSINNFEQIWETHLERHGNLAKVKITLNALDELLTEAERNHITLQSYIGKTK